MCLGIALRCPPLPPLLSQLPGVVSTNALEDKVSLEVTGKCCYNEARLHSFSSQEYDTS